MVLVPTNVHIHTLMMMIMMMVSMMMVVTTMMNMTMTADFKIKNKIMILMHNIFKGTLKENYRSVKNVLKDTPEAPTPRAPVVVTVLLASKQALEEVFLTIERRVWFKRVIL